MDTRPGGYFNVTDVNTDQTQILDGTGLSSYPANFLPIPSGGDTANLMQTTVSTSK